MEAQLMALRDREIGFDAFAQATRGSWTALATHLMRRWRVPAAVEVEDVRQELLMACWAHVDDWRPGCGTTIKKYVVYKAMDCAKRWLHGQRAALKRRDKSPSRHPVPLSTLEHGECLVEFLLTVEPDQALYVERSEAIRAAEARCRSRRERVCLQAVLSHGDPDTAAGVLYGDPVVRRDCRFDSLESARRAIYRMAANVAA